MGRRAVVVGGVCVSVLAGESSVKSIHALLNQWNSFSRSLWFSLFLSHFLIPSQTLPLSLPPSSGYSPSVSPPLWFLSLSCPTFLLSCLSRPYVCDVIQDKEAKLAWNVRLTERGRE